MSAAPLTLHRYVLVPSFLSPTQSPHPPPAVAPLSLPGPWFPAPNPSSSGCCGPTREPLEALGDPPVAAAPAPEAPSMQTAGQSSRWEGFFFLASVTSHGSWAPGVQVKWAVDFFLFRSLLDRWMDAFLAATLPAFVKNSIVRSCALLLSPPALPTFHPLLISSHLLVLWTSPLSLPCSSFTLTITLHRREVLIIFLSLFPHRLSFAESRALSLSAAIVHARRRHLRLA
ncbi:hypothetical protein M441DRAFT_232267 [Trichoderma asperellum CBS 433.97]|uniref:Uncharacterized protein n=1 Tax=Trichoderma asperellum (strain ATCC 204424 / CBS 433.97 / NBRC 101777) TaxID=1042311 RepID=A0A2T3ZQS1_TRIA4|nr:hypothetical protein M441DRAFT_232267 [Trichoderma asperellum CBS 433.97]PTB47148.1 hypothetical protein M441DRAFT_232267 [Trichoderma asperellum CBS 433.97]